MRILKISLILLSLITAGISCQPVKEKKFPGTDTLKIQTNAGMSGPLIEILFIKGPEHNHPLMAAWIEDTNHRYLQTLYVSRSIGTGIFPKKQTRAGAWEPGEQRRPAALPVWSHAYGYRSNDGLYLPDPLHPLPDAVTGATPRGNFLLQSPVRGDLPDVADLYFEINQSWDWNHYWHNNAFPGDKEYATSAQPSLVYQARINLRPGSGPYEMKVLGHGHPSGQDGVVVRDVSTFTTALQIAKKISVVIK